MAKLTNPFTGHSLDATDDVDVEFWTAAGYQAETKAAAKKAPAKKTASKSSSDKSK
jgi:hypothetical protein